MQQKPPIATNLFPNGIPEDIEYICQLMKSNQYEIYLVGGAVRDLVIAGGFQNGLLHDSDYDFTTNAEPDEVIRLFKKKGKSKIFTVPTGLAHGTVTVVIEREGAFYNYEVTTFRIDMDYQDGRHPNKVVYSKSLTEDLARRDFTINAMAYDVLEKKLYDPYNGMEDIERKQIQTVGSPAERFSEDGLRPIRACRFAAQLDFKIHPETLAAIGPSLDIVKKVSAERVHDELFKLMKAEKPSIGLEAMRESGLLQVFLPELMEGYEISQNEFHKYDVYYHNLYACDAADRDKPLVRFAALFHDIGKPRAKKFALTNGNGNVFYNHEIVGERMAERALKRLKFSNSDCKIITKLIQLHMFYYTEEWSDGAVRRFLRKFDGDTAFLNDLYVLRRADRIGSGTKQGEADILNRFRARIDAIIAADNALKVTDLDIDGNEIMAHFKIKPSRIIGEMLEYMLDKVLDNPELNEKSLLIKLGEEYLVELKEGRLPKKNDDEDISILI